MCVAKGFAGCSNFNGADTALLELPVEKAVSAETSTGNNATLVLAFEDRTLSSLDNGAFQSFFDAVTNTALVNFNLHGDANGESRPCSAPEPHQCPRALQ